MSERIKFNKVVNFDKESMEVTVLDDVFKHSETFKGATGSTFYPVSKAEYKRMTTLTEIVDRLESCVTEDGIPIEFRERENGGLYKNPYKRWAKAIKDDEDEMEMMFDTSYSELWDYMREEIGLSEKEAYIFDCSGGGRCFDKDFQGNINVELSEIIREYEAN